MIYDSVESVGTRREGRRGKEEISKLSYIIEVEGQDKKKGRKISHDPNAGYRELHRLN